MEARGGGAANDYFHPPLWGERRRHIQGLWKQAAYAFNTTSDLYQVFSLKIESKMKCCMDATFPRGVVCVPSAG